MIIALLILVFVGIPWFVWAFLAEEKKRRELPPPKTPAEAEARRVQARKDRLVWAASAVATTGYAVWLGHKDNQYENRRQSIPARQSGYLPLQSQYRPLPHYQQPVQQLRHNGPNPADYMFRGW